MAAWKKRRSLALKLESGTGVLDFGAELGDLGMMLVAQIAGLEMGGLQNWKTQEGKLMAQRSQGLMSQGRL